MPLDLKMLWIILNYSSGPSLSMLNWPFYHLSSFICTSLHPAWRFMCSKYCMFQAAQHFQKHNRHCPNISIYSALSQIGLFIDNNCMNHAINQNYHLSIFMGHASEKGICNVIQINGLPGILQEIMTHTCQFLTLFCCYSLNIPGHERSWILLVPSGNLWFLKMVRFKSLISLRSINYMQSSPNN